MRIGKVIFPSSTPLVTVAAFCRRNRLRLVYRHGRLTTEPASLSVQQWHNGAICRAH